MDEKLSVPCERCKGSGLFHGVSCNECGGKGYRVVISGRVAPVRTEKPTSESRAPEAAVSLRLICLRQTAASWRALAARRFRFRTAVNGAVRLIRTTPTGEFPQLRGTMPCASSWPGTSALRISVPTMSLTSGALARRFNRCQYRSCTSLSETQAIRYPSLCNQNSIIA